MRRRAGNAASAAPRERGAQRPKASTKACTTVLFGMVRAQRGGTEPSPPPYVYSLPSARAPSTSNLLRSSALCTVLPPAVSRMWQFAEPCPVTRRVRLPLSSFNRSIMISIMIDNGGRSESAFFESSRATGALPARGSGQRWAPAPRTAPLARRGAAAGGRGPALTALCSRARVVRACGVASRDSALRVGVRPCAVRP